MTLIMRKSETKIADRHYLMDIPAGALVVAPEVFFSRFGKTFSIPDRTTLSVDIEKNQVYCAVPSDKKRLALTPYVVRRIHNSRIKDALAGKMDKELCNPVDHAEQLFKDLSDKPASKPAPEKVNVFTLTLSQLKEMAVLHNIDIKKMSRAQITKALQVALQKIQDTEN